MIYILIYLNLLLDTVLQFSLFPLISYLDANKNSNIVDQLGFIRVVSWGAQNAESHCSHVHITFRVEHFSFYAFHKKCGVTARFGVLFKSLNVTKAMNLFLAHFRFLKKLQIFLMLLGIMHAAPPLPNSPMISSYLQEKHLA